MEHSAHRIARNSVFVLTAMVVDLFVGLIVVVLAANYLGVQGFGQYAFIRAVGFVLIPLVTFGSQRILIREMSVDKEQAAALVASGLILNVLMAIVAGVIAALIAVAFQLVSKVAIIALCLGMLSEVLMVMIKTVNSVFIAYERMIYKCATSILARLLAILFVGIVIYCDLGFDNLFAALALANAMGLLFAFSILTHKFVTPNWSIKFKRINYLLRESCPIAISTFLSQGYTYVYVFLLKAFQDVIQVSLFQAPQRIIAPLVLLPRSFLFAFVPTLSRMAVNSDSYSGLHYAYRQTLKYIFILTLPVCICGSIYARRIILFLFHKNFAGAIPSFQILIWAIVPLFLNGLLDFLLTSIKKQRVLIISNGLCFLMSCTLGLILVREYGYLGASWASLFSYCGLLVVNFYFTTKYLGFIPIHRIVIRPLLSGSAMCVILMLLVNRVHMVFAVTVGILIYFTLLFLFRTFTADEIEMFRSIIRTRSEIPIEKEP